MDAEKERARARLRAEEKVITEEEVIRERVSEGEEEEKAGPPRRLVAPTSPPTGQGGQ